MTETCPPKISILVPLVYNYVACFALLLPLARSPPSAADFLFFYIFFLHCVIPMGLFPHWEFRVGFPPQGKPAATEPRYPTVIDYKVHARSFRVSVIHRTLTRTTGSLTCVRDHSYTVGMHAHGVVGHTDSESAHF